MKTGVEALRGIRYKLRMMGVPQTGPTYVYGDNMSVIYNKSQPESTLKKKINPICYHAVCKAVASGECLTTHCKNGDNYSDMMNKFLYGKKKRDNVSRILYGIWDHKDGPDTTKEYFFCLHVCHDKDHDGTCLHACFACLFAMTKTTTEPVCMYFKFENQHPLSMKILRGPIKYAHNTDDRMTRKIPLFRFRKRNRTAFSVTANVGACLARVHVL